MMNFCMKSVHSLLGFANSNDNGRVEIPHHSRNIQSPAGGLSLVTFSGDTPRPTNVIKPAAVSSPPPSPTAVKKDPGGIGFLDEVGGSVDGLMSCTESLGFESSDERRVDVQIENITKDELHTRTTSTRWRKRTAVKREVKKFPPPLSSLNHDGKPTFFLRPVRKDGRLELTEVKIDRPEVLHASRQGGRLRLHLIRDEYIEEQADEKEKEQEEEEEKIEDTTEEEEPEEEEDKIKDIIEEEEEEEKIGEKWVFPVTNGGGDGFRRCHELVSHHHNLHAWRQHCVTIR